MIVEINPINIPDVPRIAREILDRMNEFSFNSSLMREMRSIAFVGRLLEEHRVGQGRYKWLNIHHIEAEQEMAALDHSSKLNTDPDFQASLFQLGKERATSFLETHRNKIGVISSVDIAARFL